jgi:hypothetical protein
MTTVKWKIGMTQSRGVQDSNAVRKTYLSAGTE